MSTHSPLPTVVSGASGGHVFLHYFLNSIPFQTFDDRVSKEFMDGDLIEFDTPSPMPSYGSSHYGKNRYRKVRPKHGAGSAKFPVPWTSSARYRDWVSCNWWNPVCWNCTSITLRPLLCITDGSSLRRLTPHKISSIVLLYQIGERQVRSIGMIHMAAHYQWKAPTRAGQKNIGIGSSFSTTFQCSLGWIGPNLYMWLLWLEPEPHSWMKTYRNQ